MKFFVLKMFLYTIIYLHLSIKSKTKCAKNYLKTIRKFTNPNGVPGNLMNIGENMSKKTILCIIGTRPEAIKMAPVIWELKKESWANVRVLATAQHREMLDQMLALFDIQ